MNYTAPLSLVYIEEFKDDAFGSFSNELKKNGIVSTLISKPNPGPQAAIEWLMPTAVIVAISTGFFNEIGKELFTLVKDKVGSLTLSTVKKYRREPKLLASSNDKIKNFTPAFSIYSESKNGLDFKLLLPEYSENIDYNKTVHTYLDFLDDYNDGVISEKDIGLDLSHPLHMKVITVYYNEETNRIEWIDPLPSHIRKIMNGNSDC